MRRQAITVGVLFLAGHLLFAMDESSYGGTSRASRTVPLIELRQYTLQPGKRDVLVELFENEFVESQEALGMKIVGTFRDLDRRDRFVWIRGFADMPSRATGLTEFYSGPVWKANREAANATMIDTDDVLLLREATAGAGFPHGRPRPGKGATAIPKGLVIATIYPFAETVTPEFVDFFETEIHPRLGRAGVKVRATYVSETAPNNFPRLPIREKDHVFVWFATFPSAAEYDRSLGKLAKSAKWRSAEATLKSRLAGPPAVLRLQATPRSELRP